MIDRDNYNKIFDNGLLHIDTAKILADNGSFGYAISHLILGIEELIKYQVVLMHFADNTLFADKEVDQGNRHSVFRDHLKKHDLIKEFQQSISKEFASDFQDYIFRKATGRELTEKHFAVERNRFKEWGSFFSVSFSEINIPETEQQAFFEWLNKANDTKNKGLYVNWKNSNFESPSDIQKNQFETALIYANAILKQTEAIKSMDLTDDEFMDFLNSDIE
jgi:AbiV family abortive infection protein